MRRLVLVLLLLPACAPRKTAPPRFPSLRPLALAELKKIDYVASPMFSVHYYVFRDMADRPSWGQGRVLAAHWRKELGYESRLDGLAAGRQGAVVVETVKESGAKVVLRLDDAGVTMSSAAFAGSFDQSCVLRAPKEDLLAVRSFRAVTIVDAHGKVRWSLKGDADQILAADLDGDGRDELVARDPAGGLAAYDAEGRRRWSRPAPGDSRLVAAGTAAGAPALVVRSGGWGPKGEISVLDGKGKVSVSTAVAWSQVRLAAVASGRLAAVGHVYPEERDSLSLETVGQAADWRVDLGWAEATSLAAADLDADGRDEILLGTKNGWVLVFSDEGRLLAEKNFTGEVSLIVSTPPSSAGRQQALVALKGIPPQIFAVGVVPDPGPWKAQ